MGRERLSFVAKKSVTKLASANQDKIGRTAFNAERLIHLAPTEDGRTPSYHRLAVPSALASPPRNRSATCAIVALPRRSSTRCTFPAPRTRCASQRWARARSLAAAITTPISPSCSSPSSRARRTTTIKWGCNPLPEDRARAATKVEAAALMRRRRRRERERSVLICAKTIVNLNACPSARVALPPPQPPSCPTRRMASQASSRVRAPAPALDAARPAPRHVDAHT